MNIDIIEGVQFARLPGLLTLKTAAEVKAELLSCVAERDPRIVLDLTRVEMADSSGLAAVLACVRAAHGRNGTVVMMSPTPRVRALIELTRLDDVVDLVESSAAALACFPGAIAD